MRGENSMATSVHIAFRAVLASQCWGEGSGGQRSQKRGGHRKNFVSHMFKCAVFDIKATNNH